MAYSKVLARKYSVNGKEYRSSDEYLIPFIRKAGIKGKAILDFGCGSGPEAERFALMGAKRVVGIDPSAEMIRLAKGKKLANAAFIRSNGETIPLKNNVFDLVYARFVLHYIKELEPQFVEIARVLKRKGYFLAIFQSLTDDPKLLNRRVPVILGKGKRMMKINMLAKSADEVRVATEKAKLKIVKFVEVPNSDSRIDPKYKNKRILKNKTYILFAQK